MSTDRLERSLKYRFRDPDLLSLALTHRSHGAPHNERLEFLGDATLGHIAAERLFRQYPCASEHELTLMRVGIVSRPVLAEVAHAIDLGAYVRLGPSVNASAGHRNDSILSNALEAVIGAVMCDGGIDAARGVVNELFAQQFDNVDKRSSKHPKAQLQEVLQRKHMELPRYVVISDRAGGGAAFVVECRLEDLDLVTRGEGISRREAETAAAVVALERIGPNA